MKKFATGVVATTALAATFAISVPAEASTPHTTKIIVECKHGKHVNNWSCVTHTSGKNVSKRMLPKTKFNTKHNRFKVEPADGTALTHVRATEYYTRGVRHGFSGRPDENVPLYRHSHGHLVKLTELKLTATVATLGVG